MHKSIIGAILIGTMLLLSSCLGGPRVNMLSRFDDDGKAAARLEQIIDAIKNRDRDAIKAMFSEQALSEAEDIDGGIDYLFTLFAEGIESRDEIGGHVSESRNYAHKTKESSYRYYAYSGEEQYLLSIREYIEDTDHPEKVGLYSIKVFNTKDEEPSFRSAGIYMPEE